MFKRNLFLTILVCLLCAETLIAQTPQRGRWQSRNPIENSQNDVSKFAIRGEFGGGIHASMTIGIDGLPIIAYRQEIPFGDETIGDLEVVHCGNIECSSGNTITKIESLAGFYNSVTIGGDGLPMIAYVDGATLPEQLKVAKCGNIKCTNNNTISVIDDRYSSFPSITVGPDGLPIIAYGARLGASFPILHLVRCEDQACGNLSVTTGILSVGVVGEISIGIGADGQPVMSVYETGSGALKVVHCELSSTSTCTNPIVALVDGRDDAVGVYHSLTIGDDGLPLIAYSSGASGIRVAHCSQPTCTSGTQISQLSGVGSSRFVAATIGVEGLPRISFVQGGSSLTTVQCGNKSCSNADSYHTVHSTDATGQAIEDDTSIAIGSDGLPVIAYGARTKNNETLRVAHCGSDRCLPFWVRR
jgi:predicted regulator of Ras-like GTPase activity (Roadblock/LC7/MglB family)